MGSSKIKKKDKNITSPPSELSDNPEPNVISPDENQVVSDNLNKEENIGTDPTAPVVVIILNI